MPFDGIKTEYDPNILNRRLAAELGLQAQRQAIESRGLQEALQAQLAPLQMQTQMLQARKLEQELDPAFQAADRAAKLAQAVAIAQAGRTAAYHQPILRQAEDGSMEVYQPETRQWLQTTRGGGVVVDPTQAPIQLPMEQIIPSSGTSLSGVPMGEIPDDEVVAETLTTPSLQETLVQNLGQGRVAGSPFIAKLPGKTASTPEQDAYKQAMQFGTSKGILRTADETNEEYIDRVNSTKLPKLRPTEALAEAKFIRESYEKSPVVVRFMGKGEVPGPYELKQTLDAMLEPVGNDFNKLNAQEKNLFLFTMSKFRDPTSQTLLSEAEEIASKAGLADRLKSAFANLKSGDPLPEDVAKDIYGVISKAHASLKERYLKELENRQRKLDPLGMDVTDLGVPDELAAEFHARRAAKNKTPNLQAPALEGSGIVQIQGKDGRVFDVPAARAAEALEKSPGSKIVTQ